MSGEAFFLQRVYITVICEIDGGLEVFKLSNQLLIKTYMTAIDLHASQEFILLLKKEINRRMDEGLIELEYDKVKLDR
jgi:hypothetical protein